MLKEILRMQVKSLAPDTPELGQLLQDAKIELKKSKRVDYYKILGVDKNATQDEIKKAYKRMALKLRKHLSPLRLPHISHLACI